MTGKLIIFSAPSGSGKSTIINYLLTQHLNLAFSISATSRPPRGTEQHSVFTVRFEVKNVAELDSIRNKLLNIRDVIGARRGQN